MATGLPGLGLEATAMLVGVGAAREDGDDIGGAILRQGAEGEGYFERKN